MFKEETKELKMSNDFRRKIEMICRFACVKYELISGNIISKATIYDIIYK